MAEADESGSAKGDWRLFYIVVTAVIALVLAVSAAVLYFPLRYRLERGAADRLREEGQPAIARVLAQRDLSSRFRYRDDDIVLDVEVIATGRAPWQVTFRPYLRPQRLSDFEPGATIPVRFDPANLERVAYAPK